MFLFIISGSIFRKIWKLVWQSVSGAGFGKNFWKQLTLQELTCLANEVLMFLVSPNCFLLKMKRYEYMVSFVRNTTAFDCYDSVYTGTFPLPYQYSRCLLSYACLYNYSSIYFSFLGLGGKCLATSISVAFSCCVVVVVSFLRQCACLGMDWVQMTLGFGSC